VVDYPAGGVAGRRSAPARRRSPSRRPAAAEIRIETPVDAFEGAPGGLEAAAGLSRRVLSPPTAGAAAGYAVPGMIATKGLPNRHLGRKPTGPSLDRGGRRMRYAIEQIEGIGNAYGGKLRAIGIRSTMALLQAAADPAGRKRLQEQAGIDHGRILAWANMADLMRISGVGKQFAELLEAAGVDTVKELQTRNATNLAARMAEVNAKKKLTRVVPTEAMLAKWIAEAKGLKPILTY
jgi:predicted flap endonuclease-1-like 5' DNA nuclease